MRVLYLTHRVPYAPNRGDRIRAYHTLRYLRDQGMAVHVVAFAHDEEEAAHGTVALRDLVSSHDIVRLPRMRNMGRAAYALAGSTPLTHVLLDSPAMSGTLARCLSAFSPDRVLAYCSGMARFAMASPLSGLPFVLDMVDVDSLKWESLAAQGTGPRRWIYRREARALRRFEIGAARVARATLVVSDRERDALVRLSPATAPIVVPNGVDVDGFRNPGTPSLTPDVVFSGVFNYEPNEDAAVWLSEAVWPLVLARRPDARLTLVGANPGKRLKRIGAAHGIEVTGTVADIRPYLWRASVAVAPLATARGVQNKVLEAVAAGLPVVVTPQVHEGLPAEVLPACRAAATPATFADAVVDLLNLSARERVEFVGPCDIASLGWHARLGQLARILEM